MQLPADKVKQAILHNDSDVRGVAVHYFTGARSADVTVMPLVIQAIKRFGFERALPSYVAVPVLAQTDETVRWLMEQIKKLGVPGNTKGVLPVATYGGTLIHADPVVLKNHEAAVMAMAALPDPWKAAIRERIAYLARPAEQLWSEFEAFCRAHPDVENMPHEDLEHAERLVEALGRHRERFAQKVLDIIGGETNEIGTWKEEFAIQIAGEMRLEAAIPLMLEALHEAPKDWIDDACHQAFTKIGSPAVIQAFRKSYEGSEERERLSIACTLEDIHLDETVEAGLHFLAIEDDAQIRSVLLQAILHNFSPLAIDPARRYIQRTPFDPSVAQVRHALIMACKVMGERFEEFDAWVKELKNDRATLRAFLDHQRSTQDTDSDEADSAWDDGDYADEDIAYAGPPSVPIQRLDERVGRNDPCPCGSGKKFKKCCMHKEPADDEASLFHSPAIARSKPKYPFGTVALYGPNDKITTKIAAGVITHEGASPIIERWVGTDIKDSPKVKRQMADFFNRHGVKSVTAVSANIGCPHEEGKDFPHGEDCPFCPFWKGKQGSARRD